MTKLDQPTKQSCITMPRAEAVKYSEVIWRAIQNEILKIDMQVFNVKALFSMHQYWIYSI
jgi:DNA-directed RNA polymerase specialized sigma54-like protein